MNTEGGISIERFKQISGDEFDNIASNIMIFEQKTFQEQDEVLRRRLKTCLNLKKMLVCWSSTRL